MYATAVIVNVLIARPSSPSVRLTAFDHHASTIIVNGTYHHPRSGWKLLEERKAETRVVELVFLQPQQDESHAQANQELQGHLVARKQPVMVAAHDLQVVVEKADRAEERRAHNRDPDELVRELRPEQRRHQRGGKNQQAAHRRRARLGR